MLQFFMLIIVAKNIFLILGERPTDDIDDNVDTAEKNWVLILPKEIKCFFLNLHCKSDESYLYVSKTEICKFKACNNMKKYKKISQKMKWVTFY